MAKTFSFNNGLAAPGAAELEAAALEQAMLQKLLADQQAGTSSSMINTGQFYVPDLGGVGNAIASRLTQKRLENNQKKRADYQGVYQKGLSEALKGFIDPSTAAPTIDRNYSGDDLPALTPTAPPNGDSNRRRIMAGLISPYPQVQALAQKEMENLSEVEKERMKQELVSQENQRQERVKAEEARLAAIRAGQSWKSLVNNTAPEPKEEQKVVDGTVVALREGEPVRVIAGGYEPVQLPGGLGQRNKLSQQLDMVDKRPVSNTTNITNVDAKQDAAGLGDHLKALLERGRNLSTTLPRTAANINSALKLVDQGIYQGPAGKPVELAVGLLNQFGLAGPAAQRVLSNTETFNSEVAKQVVTGLKQAFGGNPTEGERVYQQQTVGGQGLSKEGAKLVLQASARDAARLQQAHNSEVKRLQDLGRMPSAVLATVPDVDWGAAIGTPKTTSTHPADIQAIIDRAKGKK